ncbi:MAG: GDYXXLXY domain-containing protein [Victivallales bacterium]
MFIIGSVLLQLFALIYMAGVREAIIHTGKTVFLGTAPVDPRDPFRGDYVSLKYEISEIPLRKFRGTLPADKSAKYYTVLKKGESDLFDLDYCTTVRPAGDAVFIKGRNEYRFNPASQKYLPLKYGIEKYFVQQKKGLDIEKRAGRGNDVHVPLEVEVALGSDGTAVAKDYRWGQLGVGLEITERSQPGRNNWNNGQEQPPPENKDVKVRKSPKLKITLQNASGKPLAIVNLPDSRSFNAVSASLEKEWTFAKTFSEPVKPRNEDVIVLKPDEKVSFDFDFAEPRWFVNGKKGPDEIGVLCNEWSDMFRIIYAPPSREECSTLEKKGLIWHGKLMSRRFNAGRVD